MLSKHLFEIQIIYYYLNNLITNNNMYIAYNISFGLITSKIEIKDLFILLNNSQSSRLMLLMQASLPKYSRIVPLFLN